MLLSSLLTLSAPPRQGAGSALAAPQQSLLAATAFSTPPSSRLAALLAKHAVTTKELANMCLQ